MVLVGLHIEQLVKVFYAIVWIDPDHKWIHLQLEGEDVTLHAS